MKLQAALKITCIVLAGVLLFLFIFNKMNRSAVVAQGRSDSIMKAFKTIDNSLKDSNGKLRDSLNKKLQ